MKRKFRIILSVFLMFALLIAFAGCGGNGTEEDPESEPVGTVVSEPSVDISDYGEYGYGSDTAGGGYREDYRPTDRSPVGNSSAGGSAGGNSSSASGSDGSADPGETTLTEPVFHFLNSTQPGECAVVQLPDGGTLLINAGASGSATGQRLTALLDELAVKRIDYIVLSQYGSGFVGQLSTVAEHCDVSKAQVYLPEISDAPTLKTALPAVYSSAVTALRLLREQCGTVFYAKEGQSVNMGGLTAEFINADHSKYYESLSDYGDCTMCVRFTYGASSLLYTGGASAKVLNGYAAAPCTVLTANSHDSAAFSEALLKAVRPERLISILPPATAENTLMASNLQKWCQQNGLPSYVTGMSNANIAVRLTGSGSQVLNGVQPVTVSFDERWTEWY